MKKNLANCFTLLNLVFGFLAVIYILKGFSSETQSEIFPRGEVYWASVFICIAAVVDFLDGLIARICKAASELGKQLDSFADLVSFGVAPGLIVFQFLKISFAKNHPEMPVNIWYLLPAVLLPCAGAFRLARFNLSTTKTLNFQGLPIPAAGILIASFPVIFISATTSFTETIMTNYLFWCIVILLISYLMVSTLPMLSMKFKSISWNGNWHQLLLVFAAIIFAIFFHWLAVPLLFIVYILLSLIVLKKEKTLL
ncbi:hypothetical protein A9P82_06560 [Arachidicoccus ginsenosidimutans]|uniref:CDP-alcohol phosphatidyltransferase family protein n=1 Tax=Arachidicoccus sp. BS20 TaxID=1850526 RepID=UPI0007F0B7A5|nr:CDP-alcohol phosphatidyltransferase family protein [Arachidicoccus sp. BS20]ANI88984.1 hypothetical protein A9P82_06560 [Arachidicoccus sp. BS20]